MVQTSEDGPRKHEPPAGFPGAARVIQGEAGTTSLRLPSPPSPSWQPPSGDDDGGPSCGPRDGRGRGEPPFSHGGDGPCDARRDGRGDRLCGDDGRPCGPPGERGDEPFSPFVSPFVLPFLLPFGASMWIVSVRGSA